MAAPIDAGWFRDVAGSVLRLWGTLHSVLSRVTFISHRFCPDNTKSILHYEQNSYPRRNSPIPSQDLDFYFDIDKESVSKLWKSGDFEELDNHNIIPDDGLTQNRGRYSYSRRIWPGLTLAPVQRRECI